VQERVVRKWCAGMSKLEEWGVGGKAVRKGQKGKGFRGKVVLERVSWKGALGKWLVGKVMRVMVGQSGFAEKGKGGR
jgi:hypothetical protein